MNKLNILLCFASLAVLSSVNGLQTAYSDLAKKIEEILENNRQSFANGYQVLPSLDPISIPGPFIVNGDQLKAVVTDIQVTGLSSFVGESLDILSNGVFVIAANVPKLSVDGSILVEVGANYTGSILSTFSDVWVIINGLVTIENDVLSLSEIHTDITVDNDPNVKILGLPGVLNDFTSQYLMADLSRLINKNSKIYEQALDGVVMNYLSAALGTSYSKFVNKVNSIAQ